MDSIVLDLQNDAMNSDVEIADLLRKAYVVAKKLKIDEFEEWISLELRGYCEDDKVPGYRRVHGSLKFFNSVGVLSDYKIEIEKIHDTATARYLLKPIAELVDLYKKSNNEIYFEIDPGSRLLFKKYFRKDIVPDILSISSSQIKAILDIVRNIILEWSLKLEDEGIVGENLKFSPKEKEIASEHSINYNTIITNSQVQLGEKNVQNINNQDLEEIKKLIITIKKEITNFELKTSNETELNIGIETIETQLKSETPNTNIIKESLKTIRNILEGCTGSAIATVLIMNIQNLLGLIH